ncbi:MAG: SDR family NAD(P)-dependent oxidoreductase [Rhodospirillales bacterium]
MAARSNGAPLTSTTRDSWERVFDINVTACYVLAREAAKPMIEAGWGRIINIGSYVSVIGRERLASYVASKHAIAGLTKSIAGELGRHGITPATRSRPGFSIRIWRHRPCAIRNARKYSAAPSQ